MGQCALGDDADEHERRPVSPEGELKRRETPDFQQHLRRGGSHTDGGGMGDRYEVFSAPTSHDVILRE